MSDQEQAKNEKITGKLDCEPQTLTLENYMAAIDSLKEAGKTPPTAYHPEYGQILKDGQLTEAGKKFERDLAIKLGYDPKKLGLD